MGSMTRDLLLVVLVVGLLLEAAIAFCWLAGLTQIATWPWWAALHLPLLIFSGGMLYLGLRLVRRLLEEGRRVARQNGRL